MNEDHRCQRLGYSSVMTSRHGLTSSRFAVSSPYLVGALDPECAFSERGYRGTLLYAIREACQSCAPKCPAVAATWRGIFAGRRPRRSIANRSASRARRVRRPRCCSPGITCRTRRIDPLRPRDRRFRQGYVRGSPRRWLLARRARKNGRAVLQPRLVCPVPQWC